MSNIKTFFGITDSNYKFEIFDITTIITILNVALILAGFWWAPIFGLVNCAILTVINAKSHAHLNAHITQIALVVLNCYFLTL